MCKQLFVATRRGIKTAVQLVGFLLRLPLCVVRYALFSDRSGVATILVLLGAAAIAIQMSVRSSSVAIVAVCFDLAVLHTLLFRAFLWVYKPAHRIRSFVTHAAAASLVIAIFRLLEVAVARGKKPASDADVASNYVGVDEDEVKTHAQLTVIRFVVGLARGTRRLIPQTRRQLFPVLMASWFALTGCVVLVFGVSFYSLAVTGVPVLDFPGGSECLWCSITGSFSIFTTAPISNATLLGPWGLLMCGVEVADALILLGLFIALLIRLVPHDAARGLENIEHSVEEMNNEVDARLDLVIKEMDSVLASGMTPRLGQSDSSMQEKE